MHGSSFSPLSGPAPDTSKVRKCRGLYPKEKPLNLHISYTYSTSSVLECPNIYSAGAQRRSTATMPLVFKKAAMRQRNRHFCLLSKTLGFAERLAWRRTQIGHQTSFQTKLLHSSPSDVGFSFIRQQGGPINGKTACYSRLRFRYRWHLRTLVFEKKLKQLHSGYNNVAESRQISCILTAERIRQYLQ